jgi:peptidoglycan/xylan/chitin deacetylase (PgdA/CDA1 family)
MNLGAAWRRTAIRGLATLRPARVPAALTYHAIVDQGPTFRVGRHDFIAQLEAIQHAPLIPLAAAVQTPLQDETLAVTFDDGYLDNYDFAIPACVARGVPVTLFVAWDALGSPAFRGGLPMMTRDHLRELAALPGVTIGSHTLSHPKLSRLPVHDQRRELQQSKRVLEEWLGSAVDTFCYPFGDHDETTVSLVREAGYRVAVTTRVGSLRGADPLRMPRVPVNVFSSPIFHETITRGYLDYARLAGKS